MNTKSIAWLCSGAMLLLCANAFAIDVSVNCAKKNQSIGAALALLPTQGPHTIWVRGECYEVVVIERRDDLTLVGLDGASINDPTPEDPRDNVVLISESSRVRLESLKIYGGIQAVACISFSSCRFIGLEVAGAVLEGVVFSRSRGNVEGSTVIRDCGAGLGLYSQSTVLMYPASGSRPSIRNSTGGVGVRVQDNSVLLLQFTDLINNGTGILASLGGEFRLVNVTVTGGGTGVQLTQGGLGQFQGVTISGNAGNGVSVGQLSLARFLGGSVVGNDTGPDINCWSATAATQGAINASVGHGGTTNCSDAP